MLQLARVHWLRSIEFVYAVVALFALTQGPVLRLWKPSEALLGMLPNPSIPHAHFATYVVVQIPAMALWARRIDQSWWRQRENQALLALLAWLGLSVVWSTFARHSLPEFTALVLTSVFGLYLSVSYSVRQFWAVVSFAMSLGVGFSWIAVMRLWDGAVNFQENYWIGIYYNRNSLAPVAAVAILSVLSAVNVFWSEVKRRNSVLSIAMLVAGSTVVVISIIELWRSGSQTSPAALAIALAVCLVWLVARRMGQRSGDIGVVRTLTVPLVLLLASLAIFTALRFEILVGGVDTQTTAFNQRSGLWSLSWAGFLEKPWHGWGWMSAWHTPLFFLASNEPTWMAWDLEWSHNGYHDLLLGGGVPAAALFVVYLFVASRRISVEKPRQVVTRLVIVAFVLAAATQESFFIGSHFLWALLVASMAIPTSQPDLVDEKHPA